MLRLFVPAALSCLMAVAVPAAPQTPPSTAASAVRLTPPTRDPHTPGYVAAKELPDGANAPMQKDGNFILGPTHRPAPEMNGRGEVPRGTVIEFAMSSAESKLYPGIAREPHTFGTVDPDHPPGWW